MLTFLASTFGAPKQNTFIYKSHINIFSSRFLGGDAGEHTQGRAHARYI